MNRWAQAWRIARAGLDWRFRGLRLLIVCLALGVMALAAILTLTSAIQHDLAARGRVLLGGDIQATVAARPFEAKEAAFLAGLGEVSTGERLQAVARPEGDDSLAVPIELKAVDDKWPLYGRLTLADGRAAGAPRGLAAWLSTGAADRLGIGPGAKLRIGGATLTVGGLIGDEPDRLGEGFALGPTVIISREGLAATGLVQPGSMVRTKARVKLPPGADPAAAVARVKKAFPEAGIELATRNAASPGLDRFVDRMGQFLLLVALAALAIGGIGIAQGVGSYAETRRPGLATLKVLGASGGDLTRIMAIEIAAAATVGIALGLLAGVGVTPLIALALRQVLPVATGFVIDPQALATAALYGALIAVTFVAPPLAAVRRIAPMALFRVGVDRASGARRAGLAPAALGLAAIVALAVLTSPQPLLALGFLAGAAALFGMLALLGLAVTALARRAPRPAGTLPRMALANLHRPGAQTAALVLAIGFGLAAFALIAAVETSLDRNIAARVPARAPDYFVLDLPRPQADALTRTVTATAPGASVRMVPALRGTIVGFGPAERMTRVSEMKSIPDDAWPLRGDRGLTYSAGVPEGNTVTAGAWWPANYTGEPLVSIDEKLAPVLGLRLGDRIAIRVLGVERSARIASFRRIDWDSMGFNYVLVFSPNALADVPHNLGATIALPANAKTATVRRALLTGLVRAFPASSVIEIGPVLAQARSLLSQMSAAILGAASVAVLAGLAVLAGAIAAARAARAYDTVILRVLGASRQQLLGALALEYATLVAVTTLVALALGTGTAWLVVVQLFGFDWLPGWGTILGVVGAGAALVLVLAVLGSLATINARPAAALREL